MLQPDQLSIPQPLTKEYIETRRAYFRRCVSVYSWIVKKQLQAEKNRKRSANSVCSFISCS